MVMGASKYTQRRALAHGTTGLRKVCWCSPRTPQPSLLSVCGERSAERLGPPGDADLGPWMPRPTLSNENFTHSLNCILSGLPWWSRGWGLPLSATLKPGFDPWSGPEILQPHGHVRRQAILPYLLLLPDATTLPSPSPAPRPQDDSL